MSEHPTPLRRRRSELATPASSEKMCEKAARAGADLVFLDLEDACAPSMKEKARGIAVAALRDLDWGRTTRAIRVNGLDTQWCHDDIIEVVTGAADALDLIILPKARTARDVWWADVLLTQLDAKLRLDRRIGLEVLIEEAEGLANAVDIARSSDRLEAVIFGAGDLSASQRARVTGNFDPVSDYPGDFWHFARVQVVTAARVAGIDAIDSPYPAYEDPDGYRRAATHAALLLRRQVGHSPLADPDRPRGLLAYSGGNRLGKGGGADLPAFGGGRGGGYRPRRQIGRRGSRATGRERPAQSGSAIRGERDGTCANRPVLIGTPRGARSTTPRCRTADQSAGSGAGTGGSGARR